MHIWALIPYTEKLDAGNLGAITRSSFFLGVDALVTTAHSAPFSAVALKASAGAAESLPLLTTVRPVNFLDACRRTGWKIYTAEIPDGSKGRNTKIASLPHLSGWLRRHPCILILGNEGEGVREKIRKMADYAVVIESRRKQRYGVDSLNVSAAGALLIEAFMRDSSWAPDVHRRSADETKLF